MPQPWSPVSKKQLDTGWPGFPDRQNPSPVQRLRKTSALLFALQDSLSALVTGQEPVYAKLQQGNDHLRLLEMKGVWFGWVFVFVFKIGGISCKENSGTPRCISLGKLSWEFVIDSALVVSGVLTLKSCAVTAKIVKHKIQIPFLRISFHSSVFPLSPNPLLTSIAALPLHRSFFQAFLQEFCFFPWKASDCFPKMLPNTPHLFCYLSLLWWCTFISVFELYNVDQIRFPAERK